jgi:hypothetical protein
MGWYVWVAAALAQTPEAAPCTVMVPVFTVDGVSKDVGLMFAVEVGDKRVLVTAHSLFGPAGGFAAPIPAAELPTRVTKVLLRDAYETRTDCGFSTAVLPVPDAEPMAAAHQGGRDVAVFAVGVPAKGKEAKKAAENPPLVPLMFASAAPAVGDVVRVLAPTAGRADRQVGAKVVEVGTGSLYFQYDDNTVDVTGTVGAPVVNAAGQVVGINVGAGKMDDGSLIGAASPLGGVRERVEAAAR